jgi:hypothetical protein
VSKVIVAQVVVLVRKVFKDFREILEYKVYKVSRA